MDREAPETTASSASGPGDDTWRVEFAASEPATFECSLDGTAYESCSSPTEYPGLDQGQHTLAVRATDQAGNVDPTPAELSWQRTGGSDDGNPG